MLRLAKADAPWATGRGACRETQAAEFSDNKNARGVLRLVVRGSQVTTQEQRGYQKRRVPDMSSDIPYDCS